MLTSISHRRSSYLMQRRGSWRAGSLHDLHPGLRSPHPVKLRGLDVNGRRKQDINMGPVCLIHLIPELA